MLRVRHDRRVVADGGVDRRRILRRHAVVVVDADVIEAGADPIEEPGVEILLRAGNVGGVRRHPRIRIEPVDRLVRAAMRFDQPIEHHRHLGGCETAVRHLLPHILAGLVERHPQDVCLGVARGDRLGMGEPGPHCVGVGPAATVGDPTGIHPVIECEHRCHAVASDLSHDIVVVGEFGLVPSIRSGLDPGPLHRDSVDADSEVGSASDVLTVAVPKVDGGADGLVSGSGRVAPPVAVG